MHTYTEITRRMPVRVPTQEEIDKKSLFAFRLAPAHTGQNYAGTGLTQRCHGEEYGRNREKCQERRNPHLLAMKSFPSGANEASTGADDPVFVSRRPSRRSERVTVSRSVVFLRVSFTLVSIPDGSLLREIVSVDLLEIVGRDSGDADVVVDHELSQHLAVNQHNLGVDL
jgi:hypothetical protein